MQHPRQSRDGVDRRIPIAPGASQRQRPERPVVLTPDQRQVCRYGFGERRHSLIAHAAGDIDVGRKNDAGSDRAEQFHVGFARGRCRLETEIDVHTGTDRPLDCDNGRRLFDVEKHELLPAPNASHEIHRSGVLRFGQRRASELQHDGLVVRRVRIALRLRPHLPHPTHLVAPRAVDIQKGDCTHEGDRCKSEPHSRHRTPAYSAPPVIYPPRSGVSTMTSAVMVPSCIGLPLTTTSDPTCSDDASNPDNESTCVCGVMSTVTGAPSIP